MPGPFRHGHGLRGLCPRWTTPRDAVLAFLKRTSDHVSAKDVYLALQREFPGIGLTTVYRTLELLNRAGVVAKTNAGDGQSRYEQIADGEKGHHHHLICTSCGKILDYKNFEAEELELIRKTEVVLAKKFGFEISGHNIEFLGKCGICRSRKVETGKPA